MMSMNNSTDFVMGLIPKDKRLVIVDIGCGVGYWGYMLRVKLDIDPHIIGLELLSDNVEILKRVGGIYNEIVLGDARISIHNLSDRFGLGILAHFIEHIPFDDGVRLLSMLKDKCDMIIVVCPDGDARYESDVVGASHVSVWDSEKFKKLGFKTRCIPYSYRSGRVVMLFERLYFWLKGINRGGDLIAWWNGRNNIC